MKPVRVVKGRMAPLYRADVDTDQIVPKQFLKRVERTGFGPFLFYNWAHLENGEPDPSFVLNRDEYENAKILLTGANFGCGSSREHAVWAIQDRGFEAVVAPSFADIFYNNSTKVGLLCVPLADEAVKALVVVAEEDPTTEVIIDLELQKVSCGESEWSFEVDPFVRQRLLNGWDDIALTEQRMDEIARFEARRSQLFPSIPRGAADVDLRVGPAPRRRE